MRFLKKWDMISSKLLISYIITLALPTLLIFAIYSQTIDMVKKDIKTSNLNMLEQGKDTLDKNLQEVNAMVTRVALNPKVTLLTYMNEIREGSSDIISLINAENDLSTYRTTNSFVKEFFIYFNKIDSIMTSSAANTKMRLLYGNYFQFGDMSYEKWISNIAGPLQTGSYIPSTSVTFNRRKTPVITYLQTIPLEYPKINRGCIMVFIDANAVKQLLQKINIGIDGYTYILDKDNTIITSISPKGENIYIPDMIFKDSSGMMNTEISGREMVISYTVSSFNGWKYVTLVPTAYVMMKVNYIHRIIIYGALVLLLLGLMLSFFLTYKNAKPIKDISASLRELLGDNCKYKNEYTFLSGSISNLISSNRDLDKKLNSQQPVIYAAFLKRLFNGQFSDMEEINTNLSHMSIQISGSGFVVIVLKILGYRNLINKNILKELDVLRFVISRAINDIPGGRIASCDLDETRIAVLQSFDTNDTAEIHSKIESMSEVLYDELLKQSNIYVSFAVGSICTSLVDIGYSFADAKQASDQCAVKQGKNLIWYYEVLKQKESYKYSIHMEKKLIDLVMSGENSELKKLFNIIFKENFTDRKLPSNILKLFIYQMRGTLARIIEQTGGTYPNCVFDDFSYAEEAEYIYESICKCLQDQCDTMNAKKSNSDDVLEERVLNYLNDVYMQEDLTLYNIATHFSLTETYFYHFFKEKKGMTFANYLERLRMENAYSLLTETDITIGDIALKVGYNNVHSFRRAFKRCKGYIPSELRNA